MWAYAHDGPLALPYQSPYSDSLVPLEVQNGKIEDGLGLAGEHANFSGYLGNTVHGLTLPQNGYFFTFC